MRFLLLVQVAFLFLSLGAVADEVGLTPKRSVENDVEVLDYRNEDGSPCCVLCIKGADWKEIRAEKGKHPAIEGLVGKAGMGNTKEQALASLSPLTTKKTQVGTMPVYFERSGEFKGEKAFYVQRINGKVVLTADTMQALGLIRQRMYFQKITSIEGNMILLAGEKYYVNEATQYYSRDHASTLSLKDFRAGDGVRACYYEWGKKKVVMEVRKGTQMRVTLPF